VGDDGEGQLNPPRWRPPVRRTRRGSFVVSLSAEDREVLRVLPTQLRSAIEANPKDGAFRRLFPPAYENDPSAEQEYRRLVGPELDERRSSALETLAKTADATELSEEELEAWLRALNDIRLWLGTILDITEDEVDNDPVDPPHSLYHALTALQSLVIDVLAGE
jgi:Domain of unknown function (DUF2017)